jgi:hypothetical protein
MYLKIIDEDIREFIDVLYNYMDFPDHTTINQAKQYCRWLNIKTLALGFYLRKFNGDTSLACAAVGKLLEFLDSFKGDMDEGFT